MAIDESAKSATLSERAPAVMRVTTITLTPALYSWLTAAALKTKRSRSAVVRIALESLAQTTDAAKVAKTKRAA